jgi:hypothetical protein
MVKVLCEECGNINPSIEHYHKYGCKCGQWIFKDEMQALDLMHNSHCELQQITRNLKLNGGKGLW